MKPMKWVSSNRFLNGLQKNLEQYLEENLEKLD